MNRREHTWPATDAWGASTRDIAHVQQARDHSKWTATYMGPETGVAVYVPNVGELGYFVLLKEPGASVKAPFFLGSCVVPTQ